MRCFVLITPVGTCRLSIDPPSLSPREAMCLTLRMLGGRHPTRQLGPVAAGGMDRRSHLPPVRSRPGWPRPPVHRPGRAPLSRMEERSTPDGRSLTSATKTGRRADVAGSSGKSRIHPSTPFGSSSGRWLRAIESRTSPELCRAPRTLPDLGRLLAEAERTSDLCVDARDALAETLEDWQGRLPIFIDRGTPLRQENPARQNPTF